MGKNCWRRLLFPGLLLVCLQGWPFGQVNHRDKVIQVVRINGGIILDGNLDEKEWGLAEPATDFIQQEPNSGAPSTEITEVRLLHDEKNLYVGVLCYDSAGPAGIVVNDLRRDFNTRDSDVFEILLDTFDDDRNGFLFGTNPKGARFDTQVSGDGTEFNRDWDAIWDVRARITEQGWQAEIVIPFKSLRFRERQDQVWGVNFLRRIRRKNEDAYWAPLPRPFRIGRVSLAGTLQGVGQVRQGRNLIVKPYLSTPLVRGREDDVDFLPDLGLDLKYGLTPGLTLDLTLNTDFSQVEADEQQINLTRFSLFFPEKREFFLENSGIFQFGRLGGDFGQRNRDLIPFFSRRIGIQEGRLVPILGGARLSGRTGAYSLGLLSMQTDRFGSTPSTNFTVARLRRNLFRNSDLGFLWVNKDSGEDVNRTAGVDLNLSFFNSLDINSFWLKTMGSQSAQEDQAASLRVAWRTPLVDTEFLHLSIGKDFDPQVGFVPRRGIRKNRGELTLTPRPGEKISWIREFRPSLEVDYITNTEGTLETRTAEGRFSIVFQDGAFLTFGREDTFERLETPFQIRSDQSIPVGDYNFNRYFIFYSSDRSRMFSGSARFSSGGFFNGDRDSYGLNLRFQPNYHFSADVSLDRNRISLPGGEFRTNLVTSRLTYSFNTNMFLNALLQYNSDRRELASNIRLRIIHRPLSDFFLVYNESRSSRGEVLERALTAKLTYAFSF